MKQHTLTTPTGTFMVTLHAPDERPVGVGARAEAIVVQDDETTILVRSAPGGLNTPGGEISGDETAEDAMIRGVRQQACCEVTSWLRLAYTRTEKLSGSDEGTVRVGEMYLARVDILPWQPEDESIAERLVVPISDLASMMVADWPGLEEFSADLVALAMDALPDL